ncbi:hypothetical protein [Dongshaea marina]|uniref:hypothetical protein n=1 Tax=Dongshaea marina TaxID=2047966 RepID=UPI000D3E4BA4|nr:hypothetical protein [Dongshaea marina]
MLEVVEITDNGTVRFKTSGGSVFRERAETLATDGDTLASFDEKSRNMILDASQRRDLVINTHRGKPTAIKKENRSLLSAVYALFTGVIFTSAV